MLLSRAFRYLLFMLVAISTSACLVKSDFPIRSASGPDFDRRLLGLWKDEPDPASSETIASVGYFLVGSSGNVGKYVSIGRRGDKLEPVEGATFVTACLEGGCYLSVQIDPNDKRDYVFLKYELIDANTLLLHFIDDEQMKVAIAKGDLRGTFHEETLGHFGELHSSEEELRNFLVSSKGRIFSERGFRFHRIDTAP